MSGAMRNGTAVIDQAIAWATTGASASSTPCVGRCERRSLGRMLRIGSRMAIATAMPVSPLLSTKNTMAAASAAGSSTGRNTPGWPNTGCEVSAENTTRAAISDNAYWLMLNTSRLQALRPRISSTKSAMACVRHATPGAINSSNAMAIVDEIDSSSPASAPRATGMGFSSPAMSSNAAIRTSAR